MNNIAEKSCTMFPAETQCRARRSYENYTFSIPEKKCTMNASGGAAR